ncbi:uncharacterized protein LOC141590523 [Silene latifolia]|uniref:uncharacterized protein LOC141590523 n=1 Tax=Silene latifolia TaxID=37657 RepID=UPI003D775253
MSFTTDVNIVRHYESKIGDIVQQIPLFFIRLKVVLTEETIWNLLNHAPALSLLGNILWEGPDPHLSPITPAEEVTREIIRKKSEELKQLEDEVVEICKRLQKIMVWKTVVDLCTGWGRIFVGPYEDTKLLDIYTDRMMEEAEEEAMQAASSSSEDSCNIGATFY